MNCEHADRLVEYALRALPADERPGFETHLHECADCRDELAALGPVVASLVDWPTDVVRPTTPLWSRLAARIGADPAASVEERWAEEPAWKAVAPGISCKLLATDEVRHRVSMLVRLEPNTAYPAHTHAGVEELHLLAGELWIEDRKLLPGDYNRGEPGTGDTRVFSETGCTCVLITSFRDVLR
jgi:anti-sigma factor ChrR (cupin superfamily)